MNASGGRRKKDWTERIALINAQFPVTMVLAAPTSALCEQAWMHAFGRDPELAGVIYRDIKKNEQSEPGRPGPKPALDPIYAQAEVDKMMGRDPAGRPYTLLPFSEALAILIGAHSITQIARRVNLPRTQVFRLLHNEIVPSKVMMEQIAEGFGKMPGYFLEYRIGTIAATIIHNLTSKPEQSIRDYEAIYQAVR